MSARSRRTRTQRSSGPTASGGRRLRVVTDAEQRSRRRSPRPQEQCQTPGRPEQGTSATVRPQRPARSGARLHGRRACARRSERARVRRAAPRLARPNRARRRASPLRVADGLVAATGRARRRCRLPAAAAAAAVAAATALLALALELAPETRVGGLGRGELRPELRDEVVRGAPSGRLNLGRDGGLSSRGDHTLAFRQRPLILPVWRAQCRVRTTQDSAGGPLLIADEQARLMTLRRRRIGSSDHVKPALNARSSGSPAQKARRAEGTVDWLARSQASDDGGVDPLPVLAHEEGVVSASARARV